MRLHPFVGDLQHHPFQQLQAARSELSGGTAGGRCSHGAHRRTNTTGGKLAHQTQQAGEEHIEVIRQQGRATGRSSHAHIMGYIELLGLEQVYKVLEFGPLCLCKLQALRG
ncbi:hypothetical protein D3C77_630450 [compost metagenome]